jgi:hypothetical protein
MICIAAAETGQRASLHQPARSQVRRLEPLGRR